MVGFMHHILHAVFISQVGEPSGGSGGGSGINAKIGWIVIGVFITMTWVHHNERDKKERKR